MLAMVDSSVGGKTGLNLSGGKNLVGVFTQPQGVLCDIGSRKTLTWDTLTDGISEMIKYGMICDNSLFTQIDKMLFEVDTIDDLSKLNQLKDVITRCIEIKANIVGKDETDKGIRQLLNFGHTFAHPIEKLSNYSISHGHAVAIGMIMVSKMSARAGLCSKEVTELLTDKLRTFDLPTETSFDMKDLFEIALSDKKISGNKINLIIPREIGNCVIHEMTIPELKEFTGIGAGR
jgi:3-dehydroquinate synthase